MDALSSASTARAVRTLRSSSAARSSDVIRAAETPARDQHAASTWRSLRRRYMCRKLGGQERHQHVVVPGAVEMTRPALHALVHEAELLVQPDRLRVGGEH